MEISFGSEHSEPALISLDFGQSSGLSSVPASNVTEKDEVGSSSTALGNKSVSLDFSYGKLCYVISPNSKLGNHLQTRALWASNLGVGHN